MLPDGWSKYTTEHGRQYYHNHGTNQTQWEIPAESPIIKTPNPEPSFRKIFGFDAPCLLFFPSIGFFVTALDIDADIVKKRVFSLFKFFPSNVFDDVPDLYGPLWMIFTVATLISAVSNLLHFTWREHPPNYSELFLVSGALFASLLSVIVGNYMLSWRLQTNAPYNKVVSIFGYSLGFITLYPLLYLISSSFLKFIIAGIISGLAAGWCHINIRVSSEDHPEKETAVKSIVWLSHTVVWLVLTLRVF
jgi:WW domain